MGIIGVLRDWIFVFLLFFLLLFSKPLFFLDQDHSLLGFLVISARFDQILLHFFLTYHLARIDLVACRRSYIESWFMVDKGFDFLGCGHVSLVLGLS